MSAGEKVSHIPPSLTGDIRNINQSALQTPSSVLLFSFRKLN